MKIESLKPGDIVYDCHRQKMGNTTMSRMAVFRAKIISVDVEHEKAVVSWNGNSPTNMYGGQIRRLRKSPPEWIYEPFSGTKCHMCRRTFEEGHHTECSHPKAVAARKKAAKNGGA
jgi:hypothetical protein